MLTAPMVFADTLFREEDIRQFLDSTRSSSSLRSQQAMVDVASRRSSASSARPRRSSPGRSPPRSPARRRRQPSGSPSRPQKRVCFDSPAPSSALKYPRKSHFWDYGSCLSSRRVRGCLAYQWEVWESWGTEPWVVQVLKVGYSLPFVSLPPLSPSPVPLPSYSPNSVRGLALTAAVADLQNKDAIEPASSEPGFYSHLFVTPKVTGGWRPVIDLSRLNCFILLSRFRMETAQSPILAPRGLDGLNRPQGCITSSPCPSGLSQVSPVLYWPSDIPVSGSLLWAVIRSAGLYACHGPNLLDYASLQIQDPPLPRRLAPPWILSPGGCVGERLLAISLQRTWGFSQPPQEFSYPYSVDQLSGNDPSVNTFEGFPDVGQDPEGALSVSRVLLLTRAAAQSLGVPSGCNVFIDTSSSGCSPAHAVVATPPGCGGSSTSGARADLLRRLLLPGSSMVVRRQSSSQGCVSRPTSTAPPSLYGCVRLRVGGFTQRRPPVRLVDSGHISLFDQPSRASGGSLGSLGFPSSSEGSSGVVVHGRGYPLVHPQLGSAVHPSPLRIQRCSSAPPVCSWEAQRLGGFSQSGFPSLGLRVDPLPRGLPRAFPSLAGHHRPLRHLHESPSSVLLLPNGGPSGSRDRRHAPELGWPPSVCLPSFRLPSQCPRQGSLVLESRGDIVGTLLETEAMAPGHLGATGRCSGPPSNAHGSSASAAFPSFSSELPRASHDWLSYCQRSARHLGFSSRVARQLTYCRRSSTRVNYQARWVTYRVWCRSQGHSVSHFSVSKIADFLLYLRRSLHLSYSSIALCSVLSFALFSLISLLTLCSTIY